MKSLTWEHCPENEENENSVIHISNRDTREKKLKRKPNEDDFFLFFFVQIKILFNFPNVSLSTHLLVWQQCETWTCQEKVMFVFH